MESEPVPSEVVNNGFTLRWRCCGPGCPGGLESSGAVNGRAAASCAERNLRRFRSRPAAQSGRLPLVTATQEVVPGVASGRLQPTSSGGRSEAQARLMNSGCRFAWWRAFAEALGRLFFRAEKLLHLLATLPAPLSSSRAAGVELEHRTAESRMGAWLSAELAQKCWDFGRYGDGAKGGKQDRGACRRLVGLNWNEALWQPPSTFG
mmetsp:Transcript_86340/g.239422  ORF Transcript_86340/g.239422 Transcript_86340/m.239422 type:complete len:206 (-) Transcript_86340:113-730(-)